MKRIVWILLSAAVVAARADTADTPVRKPESRLFVTVEHFQWREYFDGDKLLEEKGPLFGVGGQYTRPINARVDFEGRARLFYGQVDYDGAVFSVQDGSTVPYESDTVYAGVDGEALFARRYMTASGVRMRPFAGLGLRHWLRSLDTKAGGSVGKYGYEEYWTVLYASLGMDVRVREFYGRLSLRAPLYTKETVDFDSAGGGEVDLEPGRELSMAGELGLESGRYFVALYAEIMDFSESDPDDSGIFFQPESRARIVGLRAGLNF